METASLWWRIVAILATLFPFDSNLALHSPSCSSSIGPYLWPTKLSVKCVLVSLDSFLLFRGICTTYCRGSFDSHANSRSISNPKDQNQSSLQASTVCPGTSQCCGTCTPELGGSRPFCCSESCLTSVGEVALSSYLVYGRWPPGHMIHSWSSSVTWLGAEIPRAIDLVSVSHSHILEERPGISKLNRGHDLPAPFSTPQLGREFLI